MTKEELLGELKSAGATVEVLSEIETCISEHTLFELQPNDLCSGSSMELFVPGRNDDNEPAFKRTHVTLTRFSLKKLGTRALSVFATLQEGGNAAIIWALFDALLGATDTSRTVTKQNALVGMCIYYDIRKHRNEITVFSIDDIMKQDCIRQESLSEDDVRKALAALEHSKMILKTKKMNFWSTVDDIVIHEKG